MKQLYSLIDNDTNFSHGRDAGQQDVTANPGNYNLYSKAQYDTNYTTGYNKGLTDGYQNGVNALSVTYTYHKHSGSASAGTGCYTKPVYHQHSSSCYGTCGGLAKRIEWDGNGWGGTYLCTVCGNRWHAYCDPQWDLNPETTCRNGSVLKCGKTGSITGYTLNCGMTESTVVSATVKLK